VLLLNQEDSGGKLVACGLSVVQKLFSRLELKGRLQTVFLTLPATFQFSVFVCIGQWLGEQKDEGGNTQYCTVYPGIHFVMELFHSLTFPLNFRINGLILDAVNRKFLS
jgi:hypothetical protein